MVWVNLVYLPNFFQNQGTIMGILLRKAIYVEFNGGELDGASQLLGNRSLRMGSEKNSDDVQTRPRPKPDVEYLATEDPVRTG